MPSGGGYIIKAGGYQRNYVRVSLRATASWKHLGSSLLSASGYFADLDHRSSDLVWRRSQSLLKRNGMFVVQIDEAQHILQDKSAKEIKVILNGFKDMMKRTEWPVLLVLSGVPDLLHYLNQSDELVALLEPLAYPDISYADANLEEVDGVLCAFAETASLDWSNLRNEETYNRMIHSSARRWGRLIEMVIQSMAHAKVSGRTVLTNADFADTFRRWIGASDGANVFLIENPYRVEVHKLYPV